MTSDGYLVEYKGGYQLWSPKDVFDEAYYIADTFADRLVLEKAELETKLDKLSTFINSGLPSFERLGDEAKSDLRTQEAIMSAYTIILGKRISALS
jgi:hypothetical protein